MKRLMLMLLLVVLIPQVAFAAWWNPLSWVKKSSTEQEKAELLERLTELEQKVDSQKVETNTDKPPHSGVKEKVVTQTIVVNNPELQQRINTLIAENIALQNKIAAHSSLLEQINSCKADLVNLRAQLSVSKDSNEEPDISYSDFKLYSDYQWDYQRGFPILTFPTPTSRELVVKKLVFEIREKDAETFYADTINGQYLLNGNTKLNLERDGLTFRYVGSPVRINTSTTIAVVIQGQAKNYMLNAKTSEWIIWDNTTGKQVLTR